MFPEYLFYGMTYNEFWNQDHNLVKSYREKYKLERDSKNQEMWIQGMYIHEGFAVVLNNAFGKKGSKKMKYPKEPYDLYGDKQKMPQDTNAIRQDAVNQLNAFMKKWSK